MEIVNRNELAKLPEGTVFMKYEPHNLSGSIRIKTHNIIHDDGTQTWNGELLLDPFMEEYEPGVTTYGTEWYVTDNAECDYNKEQLFAVFSKTEIRKMIDCLTWALTDCKSDFNGDEYFYGDMRVQGRD